MGIVSFRKGPEDVPAATGLLVATLVGGVLLRLAYLAIPGAEPHGPPAVLIALDLGIWSLCVLLIVRGAGHPERFVQTTTAIFGCQLVLAPVLLASRWFLLSHGERPGMEMPASFVALLVGVWLLAVTARILRSATGWPLMGCVLLAMAIEVLTVLTSLTLYPPPAAVPAPA